MKFEVDFLWIPSDLGGHSGAPYDGMRCEMIPERQFSAHHNAIRDVSWTIIEFDRNTMLGAAECELPEPTPSEREWFVSGAQFEARNGPRILSVGKIR